MLVSEMDSAAQPPSGSMGVTSRGGASDYVGSQPSQPSQPSGQPSELGSDDVAREMDNGLSSGSGHTSANTAGQNRLRESTVGELAA